jgi:APA family basic amino acid/polyamine antiporter
MLASREGAVSTERERKPLGFVSLLTLGINGTIGVGIFFAPSAVAAQLPGPSGAWVFLLAGLALLPVGLIYGRLGGRFAEDGGPYVWARLAFGPKVAFLLGFLTYISSVFSAATVITGLSTHMSATLGPDFPLGQKAIGVICVLVFASVAATGLKLSAVAWTSITILKLLPLIMLSALGIAAIATSSLPALAPVAEAHDSNLGRALLIVVFALTGFEVVPVLAGSSHSQRSMPWAVVGTLASCMLFYGVLHALCAIAVPDLAGHKAPLVAAAGVFGGETSARIVSIGQLVSAIGIAFGQTVTTPRYLSALGRADALGEWFGREDVRRVPQRALWVTATGVVIAVLREDLGGLFALASIATLAQYTVATLALAMLAHRGFHGIARSERFWALPAMLGIILVAQGAELKELVTTVVVTAIGAVILFLRRAAVPTPAADRG